jgi:phosphoglucosamine mutase
MRIAVDCAHGATYHIAGHVFHELGADISVTGNQPDGFNINRECGAVHPAALVHAVRDSAAHLGIAFDGDGDRLVMVDANGRVYDGDQLLYAIASFRHRRGELRGGVVGTLMSNLGLEQALAVSGIPFARAPVGDRYVLEKMQENAWMLGGENSGHIICLDKHTTGDGIVSALQVLHAMRAEDRSLAELTRDVTLYPQILVNVRVKRSFDFRGNPMVSAQLRETEDALRGKGRVLLRASGTEPVIRVMVEGEPKETVAALANSLADTIRTQAGS